MQLRKQSLNPGTLICIMILFMMSCGSSDKKESNETNGISSRQITGTWKLVHGEGQAAENLAFDEMTHEFGFAGDGKLSWSIDHAAHPGKWEIKGNAILLQMPNEIWTLELQKVSEHTLEGKLFTLNHNQRIEAFVVLVKAEKPESTSAAEAGNEMEGNGDEILDEEVAEGGVPYEDQILEAYGISEEE
ncbi:MAG: hypothetical protein JW801_16895 [Bacteroidales bacterium]|nr:hypothetical protein [Bacteroidales bacterium]